MEMRKMDKKKNLALILCLALIMALMAGCTAEEVVITEILLQTEELTLEIGETAALTYTYSPAEASAEGVTYTSTNPEIATVDASGLVTAVSPGQTSIVVSTETDVAATCEVTVNKPSAIDQLNEDERILFDYLINDLLMVQNISDAEILVLYGDGNGYMSTLPLEIIVTDKSGNSNFYFLSIELDSRQYYDFTEFYAYMVEYSDDFYVLDSSIMDVEKLNLALEEYFETNGE